jgi:hypothetical protein
MEMDMGDYLTLHLDINSSKHYTTQSRNSD